MRHAIMTGCFFRASIKRARAIKNFLRQKYFMLYTWSYFIYTSRKLINDIEWFLQHRVLIYNYMYNPIYIRSTALFPSFSHIRLPHGNYQSYKTFQMTKTFACLEKKNLDTRMAFSSFCVIPFRYRMCITMQRRDSFLKWRKRRCRKNLSTDL